MKIYKYWQTVTDTVIIDGNLVNVKCYGGSNRSEDEARANAKEKIAKIRQKIAGDTHIFETYEVEIREEIVQFINENAIITRNRYGAQVLNVEDVMIMDIDEPKFSWMDLFRKRDLASKKQNIIEMVRKLAQKSAYSALGYRIYETHKGIRVIVLGRAFDPKSNESQKMMQEFNCDNLYRLLCKKQDCFRARLTPKASRMNLRGHRVKFPRSDEEERAFQIWLAKYETTRLQYSVCKFVEQIGTGTVSEAVYIHDEITGARRNQELA